MKRDTPTEFGNYLRELREARNLSIRELARRSGLDNGGLVRLEQGTGSRSPGPKTLRALAIALEVSPGDLFAAVGYLAPSDLPSMSTYLRICHGDLSDETVASINNYVNRLVNEEGLDPDGPDLLEDEQLSQK
jgi:transcriptional regulator with XRE-family HTH domain